MSSSTPPQASDERVVAQASFPSSLAEAWESSGWFGNGVLV
ncbi:MAG: hypothetical protein Q3974_03210 [Rothia sp. (in: high G+C Gram-positive bacteria)]|nr:hypothetical protein [Rothia sp. (in: high G+C Gram-positive bacteria)]